ncbi:hypothetical protein SteCoe_27249 [Stentor coeruleus]|uniref:Uncharacterized protein n=1 Tax=Stentor coeruleus TaxID=5963 RepID=A0A1R2BAW9_9CILI|nr:hypothetical protein SteCoe_27249 [Stentor coeruleus]
MSIQFSNISESIENSNSLKELGLYGIILTLKTWERFSLVLESTHITTLSFQKCEISEKELEIIFQPIGSMIKLTYLDLSNNNLKGSSCGYLLGRIISKQGERRDTNKWENELRGSVADIPTGLSEIYISNNHIGDYGWEKIISVLNSDNWLKVIEAKNIDLTIVSYKNTKDAIVNNNSILILDLRENAIFGTKMFRKVVDKVWKNLERVDKNDLNNEKYVNLYQKVCSGENLPGVCKIKSMGKGRMETRIRDVICKCCSVKDFDMKNSLMKSVMVSQEYDVMGGECVKSRKKLGKGRNKKKNFVSTQNILEGYYKRKELFIK